MRLLKEYITHISGADSSIWSGLFKEIIEALVEAQNGEEVRAEFVSKFIKEYEDIRFQTFGQIAYVSHLIAYSWAVTDFLKRVCLCPTKGRHYRDPHFPPLYLRRSPGF